nr:zinc finger, CCHC-type [Tanacetum cinerariifolium]
MAENTVKEMTMNFEKLDKFEGYEFRRWQKKMHFLLSTLKVICVLTTPMPELVEDATVEAIRIRAKWENDDYICRGHILNGMSDSLFDVYTNVESAKEFRYTQSSDPSNGCQTAFLNGNLEEEVYMKKPKGFIMLGNEHKVCKLVKSLYGLKQAPKQSHQKFDEVVLSSGFHLNQSNKCVYSKFDNSGKRVIICLYVDDTLIFDTGQNQVDETKKFLSLRFSMKYVGEADVILGIKIKRENMGIVITQSHYIEKILKNFNREDCSPVSTPMDPVEKLKQNTGKHIDQLEYSRAIGYLMYAMTSTRPDISYAIGGLSRFTSNPSRQH